jgi:hypothetical protein
MVRDCLHDGILKARNLYERALTAAGLHVADGIKLWEAYREFEQAIFQTIDQSDIQVRTCSETCLLLFIYIIYIYIYIYFDR